ncbi:P25 [Hamiltonella phage APSE-1]|uniref:Putative protein p25 n=1 Tax=Acyrthosiphon pisum secondary endosymbiont phage 1 TaxID=2682836 RepID=VP25_BPAPS|nr:hypothetical protein APSE-1_25 [Hamiltonella phage APSE-1]Q9T1S3.1 RecName: Full=Putative protein p25 [Hamiltonella phage APSE-1]AAF03968.1 P25 [Hamiltonella phage APSE-1]
MRIKADISRQQVKTHHLLVCVTIRIFVYTNRKPFIRCHGGVKAMQFWQGDGPKPTEKLIVEKIRFHLLFSRSYDRNCISCLNFCINGIVLRIFFIINRNTR